ncbi:MAG: helix-turn-helix domain-containing protein, partial [Candidatus Lutacidiplasmatales archaeon]
DYPRRAQLKDVARSLGVSRATAMESLRRGIRKLASQRQSEVGAVRSPTVRDGSLDEPGDPGDRVPD